MSVSTVASKAKWFAWLESGHSFAAETEEEAMRWARREATKEGGGDVYLFKVVRVVRPVPKQVEVSEL